MALLRDLTMYYGFFLGHTTLKGNNKRPGKFKLVLKFQRLQIISWNLNFIFPFAKKKNKNVNLLFSEIVLIGQSSFKCPGSRSHTVMIQNISVNTSDLLQLFEYISYSSSYGLESRKKILLCNRDLRRRKVDCYVYCIEEDLFVEGNKNNNYLVTCNWNKVYWNVPTLRCSAGNDSRASFALTVKKMTFPIVSSIHNLGSVLTTVVSCTGAMMLKKWMFKGTCSRFSACS